MIVRVCLFLGDAGGAGSSTAMDCAAAVGWPGKPAIRFKGMDRGVGKAFGRSGTGRIRSEIGGYTDGSSEKPDRPAPHQRMAQIRREYLCLPDRSFCGWNRWHDLFGCCGSRFSMDPAQAGKKAEGTDLERVSIKINRLRGMKKCWKNLA